MTNFSTDRTLEILNNLKEEGLNIEIIEDKRAMFPHPVKSAEQISKKIILVVLNKLTQYSKDSGER